MASLFAAWSRRNMAGFVGGPQHLVDEGFRTPGARAARLSGPDAEVVLGFRHAKPLPFLGTPLCMPEP